MIIINKLKVLSLLILSGILITPTQLTRAEEIYNVSEADLIKLLEKYKNEEVVMENGLVLTIGEAINLPVTEGWTVYNKNVAEIVDGELIAKSIGSTFVSQQTDDVVYILEVCITEEGISTKTIRWGISDLVYPVFCFAKQGDQILCSPEGQISQSEITFCFAKQGGL